MKTNLFTACMSGFTAIIKNCILFVFFLLFSSLLSAQTQKSHWAMHPDEIEFNTNPPSVNPINNSNSNSYISGNSVYDENGNLIFYVKESNVFDNNSNLIGSLTGYNNNMIYNLPLHEIAIVPIPEKCDQYFIIHLAYGDNQNYDHGLALLYTKVEVGQSITVTSTFGNPLNPGFYIDEFGDAVTGGIAVSPKLEDGNRYLFCVAGGEVNKYVIDKNSIYYSETITAYNEIYDEPYFFETTELELFWSDGPNGFSAKLGWGHFNYIYDNPHVVVLDLDDDGNLLNSKVYYYNKGNVNIDRIVGFEFDPLNSERFYISVREFEEDQHTFGIYTQISDEDIEFVNGSGDYYSHIETGRDNLLYMVTRSNSKLGAINTATSYQNLSSANINTIINSNRVFLGLDGADFYTLPDQVDGENNTYFGAPISDFKINGQSLTTTPPASPPYVWPLFFNACDPIVLNDLSQYADEYRVSMVKVDLSGSPISNPPIQAWTNNPTINIKNIVYDSNGETLENIDVNDVSNFGLFKLTLQVKNMCGLIDTYSGYMRISPPAIPNIPITINGSNLSQDIQQVDPLNVYSCAGNDIILDNNNWDAETYEVLLQSTDANGNLTPGVLDFTTGELNYLPTDLKNLPGGPNGDWLTDANHAGNYKVTLKMRNECGQEFSYFGFVKLNVPPSQPHIDLQVSGFLSQNSSVNCYSHDPQNMCSAPQRGPGWIAGSGNFGLYNIEAYSRKIEEVICNDGTPISYVYEDPAPIDVIPSQNITNDFLNTIVINGSDGYFDDPTKVGNCYKLTITVYNACGSASDWSYFKLDNRLYRKKNGYGAANTTEPANTVNIYPNPSTDRFNIEITQDRGFTFSANLMDLSGRLIKKLDNKIYKQKGSYSFSYSLQEIESGMYFLSYTINQERHLYKVIKE